MNTSSSNNARYATSYQYQQSIGSSHLRLLQVSHIDSRNLSFRLRHVPRTAAPPYTAVSYTWGNDPPSEHIRLDGQIFHVRPNLWSCLYYLGLAARHADWNYLWVDAICIDQGNDNERSAQVRCMDQTYRDAACVSVWLGLIPVPEDLGPCVSRHQPLKLVESDNFDWHESMHDLANRGYWSRYWVIQEFLLGKDVWLHCSNTSMHWMDFQELLCLTADVPQFSDEHTVVYPDEMTASFAALPLLMGRHPDKHPEFLQPLATLVIANFRARCKDPRDRIFSLLGLVSDDERSLLSRFFPDYTLSINAVCIITLAHLMQSGSLENSDLRNITPNSEDIFRGLGISSESRRKFLLDQAKEMDYLDDWQSGESSRALEDGFLGIQTREMDREEQVGHQQESRDVEESWTSARSVWDRQIERYLLPLLATETAKGF